MVHSRRLSATSARYAAPLGGQWRRCHAVHEQDGRFRPAICGTLYSSILALVIATFFGLSITHNLQQAKRVADHTAFMYVDTSNGSRTGYLVEFGHTAQVFEDPREPHTQQYIRGEFS